MSGGAYVAILEGGDPDAPFPFEHYAAIESARRVFGAVRVCAAALPYGFWWDTLRPHVELCRGDDDGSDSAHRLRLDGAWLSATEFVPRADERYHAIVARLRAPLEEIAG